MNDNTITITTLGASGSGKTCFLTGMYATMRGGVKGFSFRCTDPDQDLDLSDWWDKLIEEAGAERYPPPNDNNPIEYEFDFSYGFRRLLGFRWLDYRGGALRDRQEATDVQALRNYLQQSDAVFLCVSSEHFIKDYSLPVLQSKTSAERMSLYVEDMYKATGRQPSVVIVLTKSDLLKGKRKVSDGLVDEVKELFSPLFVSSGNWLTMISSVTLGEDLAANPNSGAINPKFVHLPVAFSILSTLRRAADETRQKGQLATGEAARLRDGLFSRWFARGNINNYEKEARNYQEQAEAVERDIKILQQELVNNPYIYHNGRQIVLT